MKVLQISPDTAAGVPARMAQTLSYANVYSEVCTYDRAVDIGFDLGLSPVQGRLVAKDYDVLHFHHLTFYNLVRSQFPKPSNGYRHVVTIHGLPDDQLHPAVPDGVQLHVVHAHLLKQFPEATFLPNWILDPPFPPDFPVNQRPRIYYTSANDTRRPGDMLILTRALPECEHVFQDRVGNGVAIAPNDVMLEQMRKSEFVFDQLRGDVGLVAYEAMASGAIPIVAPTDENREALDKFYGVPWPLSFTDNMGQTIALIKHLLMDKERLMMVRHLCRNYWKAIHDPLRRAHQLLEIYNAC